MNKLRKQFHEDTENEWLPPYYDLQDQLDAEVAFSNWMVRLAGSRHATIMKQADKIGELIKGIDGRDKTILAWLAKSNRQEKKIKKLENQCSVNLIAFNKASSERFALKNELESWKETAEGNLNMLKDRDSELSTLKQSIADSTHSRFRIADWLDCDNPPDNWFKKKLYAIVDLKDELESWQEIAEGNLNMLTRGH